MQFKDYYKILGVAPGADLKAIKTAYRKLARKFHPDVSEAKDAEEKFKEVAEAYAVLKDTDKRAEYDEIRQYGRHGQEFKPPPDWQSSHAGFEFSDAGGMSDFFQSIFGQAGAQFNQQDFRGQRQQAYAQRGQDVEIEMPIFLEDTLSEKSKSLAYEMPHYDEYGRSLETIKKNLQVKIPKGVGDGERIRLKGQGAPGIGNAPNGDLYLHIRLVPHPLFDVEGHNLNITVPVAPWEAALGTEITLPTLQGKINLRIPANSQTGQRLRVKGRGLIGKIKQGDLFAVLKVVMPQEQNVIVPVLNELWKKMSETVDFNPRSDWS
jgi:curved DNA-binding protein